MCALCESFLYFGIKFYVYVNFIYLIKTKYSINLNCNFVIQKFTF